MKGDNGIASVKFNNATKVTTNADGSISAVYIYGHEGKITVSITGSTANLVGGYSFNEWSGATGLTFKTGNKNTATIEFNLPDADLTLTATSKVTNVYTITYNLGGGTINDTTYTTKYKVDQEITLPKLVKRAGYTFIGWQIT